MSNSRPRAAVSRLRRIIAVSPNPVVVAFRMSWDGSIDRLERFLDDIDGWAATTSERDAARDLLEDLRDALRADS